VAKGQLRSNREKKKPKAEKNKKKSAYLSRSSGSTSRKISPCFLSSGGSALILAYRTLCDERRRRLRSTELRVRTHEGAHPLVRTAHLGARGRSPYVRRLV
jgi:hypothetical protein